jgi:hypothetical protein
MPLDPLAVMLSDSEKENAGDDLASGLMSMFKKQQTSRRRRSAVGIGGLSLPADLLVAAPSPSSEAEIPPKRAALPLSGQPDKPAAGSPVREQKEDDESPPPPPPPPAASEVKTRPQRRRSWVPAQSSVSPAPPSPSPRAFTPSPAVAAPAPAAVTPSPVVASIRPSRAAAAPPSCPKSAWAAIPMEQYEDDFEAESPVAAAAVSPPASLIESTSPTSAALTAGFSSLQLREPAAPPVEAWATSSATASAAASVTASAAPPPPPRVSAVVSAACLLRRAVHVVDAQAPRGGEWKALERALLELCGLLASWDAEAAAAVPAPPVGQRARLVSFCTTDGSHLEPPLWGRDPPLPNEAGSRTAAGRSRLSPGAVLGAPPPSCPRVAECLRLAAALSPQRAWLELVRAPPPSTTTTTTSAKGSLSSARRASSAATTAASRAQASPRRGLSARTAGGFGSSRVVPAPIQLQQPSPALMVTSYAANTAPATTSSKAHQDHISAEARALLEVVRGALGTARDEAVASLESSAFIASTALSAAGDGSASAAADRRLSRQLARVRSCHQQLDHELSQLATSGRPILHSTLSDLLCSCVRLQLRRIFEHDRERAAALLTGLPRGRAVGFLAKADSAAKVLSCALYESHSLNHLLDHPTLVALLHASERDARDALRQLPSETVDELLTLHEAHAALRHLLCASSAAPRASDAGWLELRRLLALVDTHGCTDEAHYLPLSQLEQLKGWLFAQQNRVPALVRLLDWSSPQAAVHLRTRGAHAERAES